VLATGTVVARPRGRVGSLLLLLLLVRPGLGQPMGHRHGLGGEHASAGQRLVEVEPRSGTPQLATGHATDLDRRLHLGVGRTEEHATLGLHVVVGRPCPIVTWRSPTSWPLVGSSANQPHPGIAASNHAWVCTSTASSPGTAPTASSSVKR